MELALDDLIALAVLVLHQVGDAVRLEAQVRRQGGQPVDLLLAQQLAVVVHPPLFVLRKTPEAVLIPRADEAVVVVAVDGAHPVLAHPGDGAAGIWAVVDVVARAVDGVDVLLLREDGADALGVGVEIGDDEELQRLRSFRWSVCIDPG